MDYNAYRRAYFTDPPPEARFDLTGIHGATLFFSDFERAVEFYTAVLGTPGYVEGPGTVGWRLGDTWLTLLAGGEVAPRNVEVPIVASTPAEAERLQAAFIDAGATGTHPQDGLMYVPVRLCPVTDPFGASLLIYSPLPRP
jgi:catechol 2,3-dioxygenase-like lactoylglutathione lyase family enzyme